MIQNYLKIAFRNIKKQKLHSFINILGLAVGLSATFLIFNFVQHELSYDKFNKDADHIYRFVSKLTRPNGQSSEIVININKVGPEVKDQFPQVKEMLRIKRDGSVNMNYNDENFSGYSALYADSTFFNMFDYQLVRGNPSRVLADPKGIVINEKMASRIFNEEDPIGKIIKISQREFRITGVMKDFPAQSHLQYDMLIPLKSHPYFDVLGAMEFVTYIKIDEKSDSREIRNQICTVADDIFKERFEGSGYKGKNNLQPLLDIHLKSSGFQYDFRTNGDIKQVYIYTFLALLILLVAVINYINLFTAKAESRTKEVGLRKVVGAFRQDLMKQFLSESFLITLLSFVIALGLLELSIGRFGELLGRDLSTGYLNNPELILYFLGIVLVVGVFSGYYPAFYLSKFNVIRIFRGGQKASGHKNWLTVFLVITQFIIAIFLISSVIVFNKQVSFMKSRDMGFSKDQVLVVEGMTGKLKESYGVVKEKLLKNPQIKYVTSSQAVPGIISRSGQTLYEYGQSESSGIAIKENRVNYDYIETFGIKMKEGRSFSKKFSKKTNPFIINETAQKEIGLQDPVGKKVSMGHLDGKIIGVMEDYNYASLQHEITPLLMTVYHEKFNKNYFSIKIASGDFSEVIDYVKTTMEDIDPNYNIDYYFLDNYFDRLYKTEERSTVLITFATILSLVLAFLGLFGLTSFTVIKRTKEIGIRKVMGASPGRIVKLLSGNMIRWIVIAAIIAFPLIYYVMNAWLQEFAYKIDIQLWMLLVSAVFAVVVALLTTSVLTFRAANTNPANTLRDE